MKSNTIKKVIKMGDRLNQEPVSLLAMAARMNNMEEQIKQLESSLKIERSIVRELSKTTKGVSQAIGAMDPEKVSVLMSQAKEDAKFWHKEYRSMYFKMMTATELHWLITKESKTQENTDNVNLFASKLIFCFDYDDSWWKERSAYTLQDWKEDLEAIDIKKFHIKV